MEPFYRLNDYDQVAELTWENGQVGCQGLVPATCTRLKWETANETLESIVQQGSAVLYNHPQKSNINLIQNSAVNIKSCSSFAASSSDNNHPFTWLESGTCNTGADRRVSVSGTNVREGETNVAAGTTEEDLVYKYVLDDKKDERESKGIKGHSSSTRRSRTAAVHNQSERKRRDRINQKMKILQRLVPNASKTDKASMLDEVIKHLKDLQSQIQTINFIRNMPQMMVPLGMQQQQQQMQQHNQMLLFARAGLNMNLGMLATGGMPSNINTTPIPLHQFLPSASTSSHPAFPPQFLMVPPMIPTTSPPVSQSINMDLYNKMAVFCSQQANMTTATMENKSSNFQ